MPFVDCSLTAGGGLDLPADKFHRMVAVGQFVWVDPEQTHVRRDLQRKTGAFVVGEEVLAHRGWLRVTHLGDRVQLQPVPVAFAVELGAGPRAALPQHALESLAGRADGTEASTPRVLPHALARWVERVVPRLAGAQPDIASVRAHLALAAPVVYAAERRSDVSYLRLRPAGAALAWIDFVVADGDTPDARVITVVTDASHAERFPSELQRAMSRERSARAAEVRVQAGPSRATPADETVTWSAIDLDGKRWEVSRSRTQADGYGCTCPDFVFRAGRAGVPCKHIWAVRHRFDADEPHPG